MNSKLGWQPIDWRAPAGTVAAVVGLLAAGCGTGSVTEDDSAPQTDLTSSQASSLDPVKSSTASDVAATDSFEATSLPTTSEALVSRERSETSTGVTVYGTETRVTSASTSDFEDAGASAFTGSADIDASSSLRGYFGDAGTLSSLDAGIDSGLAPWVGAPIVAKSGFIDIEPISYVRHNVPDVSSSARLFYSFQPADSDPHLAPTFVFFNGGPGYATTMGLLARGTAPMTIGTPEDSSALVANPWSWTQLGNLLYIDTRQAGYSYSTLPDPSDVGAREFENRASNFNDYLDAADLVRVMLRVLAATPGVQENPVVLVGESFGGVRATLMLEFLLEHDNLRGGTWYNDPTLADEVADHYAAIGASYGDPRDQFAAQVLIQPFIAHTQFPDQAEIACLPGSKEVAVANSIGVSCQQLRDVRDAYNIDEVEGWSYWLDTVAAEHLTRVESLQSLLGVDPRGIVGLSAAERSGAFRFSYSEITATQSEFFDEFGVLNPWDAYHVTFNQAQFNGDIYDNPYPCVYFARVLARVATFVTDADADLVVDTPALPTTMMKCQQLLGANAFVDDIVATKEPMAEEARPGHWTITYNANSPQGAGERKVRWPTYVAGHMVAVSQPQQLFEDVRDFLRENAVIP